jgi:hypothetical protein
VKRGVAFFAVLIIAMSGSAVFAQQQPQQEEEQPSLFASTIFLNRVYSHRMGYKVEYLRSDFSLGEAYLPNDWFTTAAGKGDVIYTHSASAPYLEVYYDGDSFHHVKLFVRKNTNHSSWARLEESEGLEERFNTDTLALEY